MLLPCWFQLSLIKSRSACYYYDNGSEVLLFSRVLFRLRDRFSMDVCKFKMICIQSVSSCRLTNITINS